MEEKGVDLMFRIYPKDQMKWFLFLAKKNPLNEREQEMLRRVRSGESTKEIAKSNHLSLGTVRNYLSTAMQILRHQTAMKLCAKLRSVAGYKMK
ncbi:response regulator transcription factor [Bacillus sp. CRN 9]|nr:response regulator transcription factor [Bacillus sp. CRN 9]